MSDEVKNIEFLPPFQAHGNRSGFAILFRTKYVGFGLSAGWRWAPGVAFTLLGWEVFVSGERLFNGPRRWSLGSIAGFLRFRVGFDAHVFTGQRDPAIMAQIEAAQEQQLAQQKAAMKAAFMAQPKVVEVGAPVVEKVLPGEDGLTVE